MMPDDYDVFLQISIMLFYYILSDGRSQKNACCLHAGCHSPQIFFLFENYDCVTSAFSQQLRLSINDCRATRLLSTGYGGAAAEGDTTPPRERIHRAKSRIYCVKSTHNNNYTLYSPLST